MLKHQTLFMLEIRQMVWIYLATKMHLKLNFSFQMPLFKCTKKVLKRKYQKYIPSKALCHKARTTRMLQWFLHKGAYVVAKVYL